MIRLFIRSVCVKMNSKERESATLKTQNDLNSGRCLSPQKMYTVSDFVAKMVAHSQDGC